MSWSRHTYQQAFDIALQAFMTDFRAHNRPEVCQRVLSEAAGKRDTVTFTQNMYRMVSIMDLCQDVIGQQADHPGKYFPALLRKKRRIR